MKIVRNWVFALDYFKNEYHNYIDNYFKNNQKTDKKSSDYYPVYKCIEWEIEVMKVS